MPLVTEDELAEAVDSLRHFRTDTAAVEAKACQGDKLPKTVRDTLSSFSNSPSGGVLILGLAESEGFRACGVGDPGKIAADLAGLARTGMEPPVSPLIEIVTFEGADLVVAEVPEMSADQKPCHYKGAGVTNGSFVRTADGDYRLTSYEVQLMVASRGQPRDDEEPVVDAAFEHLDSLLLEAYIDRVRLTRPQAFDDLDDLEVLKASKVLVRSKAGHYVPSLAGLLAFGRYPQEFFPQLNVTFVSFPTDDGQPLPSGERFIDNATVEGNVPTLMRQAQAVVRRNMQRRGVVNHAGREDVWGYPTAALREVIVNALVHRDLSSPSRGMPVQIEMYPNRLLVRNPGGLYGPVTLERLGQDALSSSRNAVLLKILEDVPAPPESRTVCENRGSGVRVMITALREAGMGLPKFEDRISTFTATFPKHSLFSEDVIAWVKALGQDGLTDTQHTALALLRNGEALTNPLYRTAVGIDSRQATIELQDLVGRELVVPQGKGRWTRYVLSPSVMPTGGSGRLRPKDRRTAVLHALGNETLSRREVESRSGLPRQVVTRWLQTLRAEGLVDRTPGPAQSRNIQYWATRPGVLVGQETLPGFERQAPDGRELPYDGDYG